MKKIFAFLIILLIVTSLTSCSTQKVSISAKPGTEIYSPKMVKLADVPNSGTVYIKISRDDFYGFLLTHEKDSDKFVPFAMNYRRNAFVGAKATMIIGAVASFTGSFGLLISSLATGGGAAAGYFGAAAIGGLAMLAIPALSLSETDQFTLSYSYLRKQSTNQDITIAPIVQTADYKTISKRGKSKNAKQQEEVAREQVSRQYETETDYVTGKTIVTNDSEPIISKPKKPTVSSAGYSSKIAGTYIGKGKLINSGDIVDIYTNVKVVISKQSENTVSVNVIMSNGLPYFRNAITYKVTKNEDNIVLKTSSINSTITINEYGELEYVNHNVEDKEEMCTLKINADLE